MMGGMSSQPCSICPLALDTHARLFGIRLRGPQVWIETSSLENVLQPSQSWDWHLFCLFVLLILDQKNAAKSRAGEGPLKADLQLTGMITQNHSCFPKMLNVGFFVLPFLAYTAVTCSYIHSWHGASALSPFLLLFHMASFFICTPYPQGRTFEVDGQIHKDSRNTGSTSNNTNTLETSLYRNTKVKALEKLIFFIKKSSQDKKCTTILPTYII